MEENQKNLAGALLVGKSNDDFVRFAAKILAQFEITSEFCGNIYSAVANLAKKRKESFLIVGRLGEFGKENAKLLDIAKRNGHICCCLADSITAKQLFAVDHLINESCKFEEVVKNLFNEHAIFEINTREELSSIKKDFDRKYSNFDFKRDDFAPSKAELDALFGGIEGN